MYLDKTYKHRNSDKTGLRSVSRSTTEDQNSCGVSSRVSRKLSHPKETGTLVEKQHHKTLRNMNNMYKTKYKNLQYSHQLAVCDLFSEEFKIAILNNSVCYRKYSKRYLNKSRKTINNGQKAV